ncbi:uncharacterized protein LOC115985299 [Quercus lobata]|uniref:uncharacterized protein LOC115985299 n=1 Tax=Quercus lobata TaxID=97700 RepID=UPI001243CFE0|nr:uncharacterized protein LOC115985299 [Quercus lobata]
MVVKSKVVFEHVRDLDDVFEILRRHKLRLNASKCSFGVGLGKVLGYMVTHKGIKVSLDQIRAVNSLQPPRNLKEVQKLTGMIVTLNCFISQLADRCRPFFLLLNKWKGFEWNEECALAFQQLKEYLSRPPIMSNPTVNEVLFAYIVVASHAVSLVLIRMDNGVQRLVYYAHTVIILTQLLLRSILRSADYTRRIAKWGTILGAFDIKYMPRTSMKGQVLADLVAEFAEPLLEEEVGVQGMDEKLVSAISLPGPTCWKVYVDGTANQRGSRMGLILVSPKRVTIKKSLRLGFSATNNEVEEGMSMVQKLGGKAINMFSDSRLIIGQVNGELEARDERMQEYLDQTKSLRSRFDSFSLLHIIRSGNTHADSLATLATSSAQFLPRVILMEDLYKPSVTKREVVHVHHVRVGPN